MIRIANNRRTKRTPRTKASYPTTRYKNVRPGHDPYEKEVAGLLAELAKGPKITGAPPPKPPSRRAAPPTIRPTWMRQVGRKRKRGRRAAGKQLAPKTEYQTETIKVVSRRGQPQVTITVPKMVETLDTGGQISSSWISTIEWYAAPRMAYMTLLNGYEYEVYIPFPIFRRWYWAHSKGTFFNYMIKGKFRVIRTV